MGVNLFSLLVSYPRHWFPSYYCSHSLSRKSACTLSASMSPMSNTARLSYAYGTGALPDRPPGAQASHRGLERPSEPQLDSSSVPPMLLGTIRWSYLHSSTFPSSFLITCYGAQPYLAIKVQGNVTCYLRRCRNFGSKSCTQLVRLC